MAPCLERNPSNTPPASRGPPIPSQPGKQALDMVLAAMIDPIVWHNDQMRLPRPSIDSAKQPIMIFERESVVPISNTHQSPIKRARTCLLYTSPSPRD